MSRSLTRRLTTLATAGLIAGAAALGVASPAFAHDELINTTIVTNESDGTLEGFKLSFSNSIIEVGTEIVATAADGSSVTDGAPVIAGPDVTQALKQDLGQGKYKVAWRVVSSDGHPIEGGFSFTVDKDGKAGPAVVETDSPSTEATEDADHDHADGEDHDHATTEQSSLSTGAIVAISVGGVAVLAVVIATVIIGQRRRAQAFGTGNSPVDNTSKTEEQH